MLRLPAACRLRLATSCSSGPHQRVRPACHEPLFRPCASAQTPPEAGQPEAGTTEEAPSAAGSRGERAPPSLGDLELGRADSNVSDAPLVGAAPGSGGAAAAGAARRQQWWLPKFVAGPVQPELVAIALGKVHHVNSAPLLLRSTGVPSRLRTDRGRDAGTCCPARARHAPMPPSVPPYLPPFLGMQCTWCRACWGCPAWPSLCF